MKNEQDYQFCSLVRITGDAYSSCLNHALLTDQEEVMGLLIGNQTQKENKNIINIFATLCLTRKCKQKDRVEFDEVQIAQAVEKAEQMKKEHKVPANVIGWYHSHPKATPNPSQVDLETQRSQQYQGSFVGLIISCFNNDINNVNKINLIAFQTKKENYTLIPHYIDIDFINEIDIFGNTWSNTANTALTYSSILKNLLDEEEEQFNKEKEAIESDDCINNILLMSNRQSLLCKIIQNVSAPYSKSLSSEINNLKYYLEYMNELNKEMKRNISQYEALNQFND